MNEKIRILAEQAAQSEIDGKPVILQYTREFAENLAILIIKECINCCDDSDEEYSKNVNWGVDRIVDRFNLQPIQRKEPIPKCFVCGTTENVHYIGGFQPWLCDSVDCIPF